MHNKTEMITEEKISNIIKQIKIHQYLLEGLVISRNGVFDDEMLLINSKLDELNTQYRSLM